MHIGCHMSISKGFANMLKRAQGLGADAVQYFPKNPKTFQVRVFDKEAFRKEYDNSKELGIVTVCHSPYVTNIATPDQRLRGISIASIVNDLEIAEAYGTQYLVVHCGKHVGEGEEKGFSTMAESINEVLERYSGPVELLLENTAGQGSELGRSVDELMTIHASLSKSGQVGFCFDTCHAFAAGLLDFNRWDDVAAQLAQKDFHDKVKVVHLNDSKAPFNSKKDRHEMLGNGEIGSTSLELFLTSGLFADVPVIVETPVDEEEEYAGEIAKVRGWIAK